MGEVRWGCVGVVCVWRRIDCPWGDEGGRDLFNSTLPCVAYHLNIYTHIYNTSGVSCDEGHATRFVNIRIYGF
jgi:hypothetical protein